MVWSRCCSIRPWGLLLFSSPAGVNLSDIALILDQERYSKVLHRCQRILTICLNPQYMGSVIPIPITVLSWQCYTHTPRPFHMANIHQTPSFARWQPCFALCSTRHPPWPPGPTPGRRLRSRQAHLSPANHRPHSDQLPPLSGPTGLQASIYQPSVKTVEPPLNPHHRGYPPPPGTFLWLLHQESPPLEERFLSQVSSKYILHHRSAF